MSVLILIGFILTIFGVIPIMVMALIVITYWATRAADQREANKNDSSKKGRIL